MKKEYKSPASFALRLHAEGMMATSLDILPREDESGSKKEISAEGQILSDERKNSSSGVWKWMDD